ncbi:unnamed protein product [Pylaiella littoralis]
MSKKKTLSDRLAELTSAAPSAAFNPDAPDFDDGTGAGTRPRYGYDDADDGERPDSAMEDRQPSADLRVAADMESIGLEYHGKRVSRKNLEATAVGDARDPEQASEGGSDIDDDDDSEEGGGGGEAVSSSTRIVESLNLDDVSSSSEEDGNGDGDDDGSDDDSGGDGGRGEKRASKHGSGGKGKRVHWGGQETEGDANGGNGSGGKRPRQQQSNVFANVKGQEMPDASVGEQMRQLDRQDERARRAGGGVAGQGELRRAREALRQREWWDSLLEVRILLQRLMNAANKLPGPDELQLYLNGDDELTALAEEGSGAAKSLATQLSAVRRSQMACWGITAKSSNDDGGTGEGDAALGAVVTDDAEEEEGLNNEVGRGGEGAEKGEDAEAVAAKEHGSCMGWWEGVLGRWHEKTQLVDPSLQKKFKVVNQGPWAQVTASLADRDRANRRAFMTESETADFLGRELGNRLKEMKGDSKSESAGSPTADREEENEELLGRERRKEGSDPLDLEVIDDRDLYQHLLKEFMDASGAAGSGYAAVPVRRKSRKKNVDRKASKGRKIKYVTHPKMQNFMFPQEYDPPPMEPSELFTSLFGGAGGTR